MVAARNPRALLVKALTTGTASATASGDLHAARVAYEALGKLLADADSGAVADLATFRAESKRGK